MIAGDGLFGSVKRQFDVYQLGTLIQPTVLDAESVLPFPWLPVPQPSDLPVGPRSLSDQPTLQRLLHVAVRECRITPARMLQGLTQKSKFVFGGREECFKEAVLVVMGDVAKGHRQTPIKPLGKLALVETGIDEFDELLCEMGLLVGSVPLRGRELVGREIVDVGENGCGSSS